MAEEREEESTSPAVTEDQIVEETPATVSQEQNFQEENLQEQNKKIVRITRKNSY
jgi:hypothetical protein